MKANKSKVIFYTCLLSILDIVVTGFSGIVISMLAGLLKTTLNFSSIVLSLVVGSIIIIALTFGLKTSIFTVKDIWTDYRN